MTTTFMWLDQMSDVKDERHLQIGSTGDRVRLIQTMLATLGYSLGSIDGVYGKRTARAVRQFQIVWGLFRDGVVGPLTQAALFGRFSDQFQVTISEALTGEHESASNDLGAGELQEDVAPDTPIGGLFAVEERGSALSEAELIRWLKTLE